MIEYAVYADEKLLFICENESLAQEMVLALTEEYIYNAFYRECNNCGVELALWLFKNAPKYGWNKYYIKPVKRM